MSGTVYDESGNPLIGVSVLEKGTKNGTATDIDGNFTISVSDKSHPIIFSYIGFLDLEIEPVSESGMRIVMEEDSELLDEVQVIGYAVIKKSDLTGSVASVKADVMEDRMVLSVEDALRGQLAGVSILSTDGAPGASMNIRIRGTNSINASNSPLYVVDGVLMESTDISPSEIESMEILKDASSTAIYGSRGANGVVIITTKKGRAGAPRINFSATVSMQQPVRLYEMMNAEEFEFVLCIYIQRQISGNSEWRFHDRYELAKRSPEECIDRRIQVKYQRRRPERHILCYRKHS